MKSVHMLRESPADTYGQADVLVHASIEDGFGLVVSEALACGRPVIVTDTTGACELVRDGENGFVVPARQPRVIADRLAQLAGDRALLARMSAAAPASVAHFGYPAFIDAVHRFYAEVAA
jgi:glycosyltransferase involved in cell wall biosynthesis